MQEPSFSVASFTASTTAPTTASTSPSASVTCAATSSKFVVLGLSDGSVSLYDVFANRLDHHDALHSAAVTAVALGGGPASDQIVASASMNAHLRVARLFTSSAAPPQTPASMLCHATVAIDRVADATVVALAVDPAFGKPRFGDRVAYSDSTGRVVVYTAGWFGGTELVVYPPSAFPVLSLAWFHNLLIFPASDGVRVFDTRLSRLVCRVASPGHAPVPSPMPASSSPDQSPQSSHSKNIPLQTSSPATSADPLSESLPLTIVDLKQSTHPSTSSSSSASNAPWALHPHVHVEYDKTKSPSNRGEPAIRLYLTWPAGARVIRIGPHNDHPPPNTSTREIDVMFKLERNSIPLSEGNVSATPLAPLSIENSPLLSVVPFGDQDVVALIGLPSKGLVIHLISPDGQSIKHMVLPHRLLHHASLLTVPGGDPLVLVIGHPDENSSNPVSPLEEQPQTSPAEVMYVRSLTTAERVKWLLGQNRFQDALAVAQSAPGGSLRRAEVSLADIGEQFLESLKEIGDFDRLASMLDDTISTTTPFVGFRAREKILQKRKIRWERWIDVFRKSDQLPAVAAIIPTYEPCLDEDTYSKILVQLAATSPPVMLDVLKTWPADVFGVSTVTKAIEQQLGMMGDTKVQWSEVDREPLREGLLMMYGLSGRHDETLNLLLREQSPKVYDYIRAHHLYEAVRSTEKITGLYTIDANAATDVLSHAPETVLPPDAVVPILSKVDNSLWTFMYLHAVFRMDAEYAPKYHNQLLKLYVGHGVPGALYLFLRTSTHYSLDVALEAMGGLKVTRKGHLAKERVYVLSAMGDLNSAMNILLDELGDTFSAIEFASDHGDVVLWERLIEHARTHADTLAALLDSPAGGKVDPIRLIPLLKSDMRIPHLRDRLHRILVDAALERALREDAAAALHHDANELLQKLDATVSLLSS